MPRLFRQAPEKFYPFSVQLIRFLFKITRGDHRSEKNSNEECNCLFTVKWKEGKLRGKQAELECGSICLIPDKNILQHHVVQKFLAAVEPKKYSKPKPSEVDEEHEENLNVEKGINSDEAEKQEYKTLQEKTEVKVLKSSSKLRGCSQTENVDSGGSSTSQNIVKGEEKKPLSSNIPNRRLSSEGNQGKR